MEMDGKKYSRKYLEVLRSQLEQERSSFLSHWRDLADYILPTRPRFLIGNRLRGERKNLKIIDSEATFAVDTLQAGMMSGITSPARPWFRLGVADLRLMENNNVKSWLEIVERDMQNVFLKSNLYDSLPNVYSDCGVFGTSPMLVEEDFESVVRFQEFPVGSYCIANDSKLRVRKFLREFEMTVSQVIEEFATDVLTGKPDLEASNVSPHVRNLYKNGQTEVWVSICHFVLPNPEYDARRLESEYKKYISLYYEKGLSNEDSATYGMSLKNDQPHLRQEGYDYFPVLCPRWATTSEDSYGTYSPGMRSLGDVKQLQTMQRRKAQAVEKSINPPMVGPATLKNGKSTILPGDTTYLSDSRESFRPAHEVRLDLNHLMMNIQDTRESIRRSFYSDLFLMMANSNRREITAREIEERHEEKLLALGPVLERLNRDLLDPLIDITFSIMEKQGMIPPPPEELQGKPLKVEYVSIMAQAQKLVSLAGIERFTGFVSGLIQINPEVTDKVDFDQMVDNYGDITSVAAGIVRSDEEVDKMRQARQRAQQAQAQAEMIQQGAGAAKDLSQANMEGDNALTQLLQQ